MRTNINIKLSSVNSAIHSDYLTTQRPQIIKKMFTMYKVNQYVARYALKGARNMSAMSGPPMDKISSAEKMIHGAALFVGMLAVPTWVLVNIKKYRGQE